MRRQTWLVTGCSSGLGRAIATAALEAGHAVTVTARNCASVADLVARFPETALAQDLDITRPDQIVASLAAATARFGALDVLVNNAGYGYLAAIEEGEEAAVRTMFDTNFHGPVALIKAVLPAMRARGAGRIINISSMTGLVGNPAAGYYAASKFALEGMTEALAKEVAPFGIKVTAVQPGGFRTDWSGRSMQQTGTPIADYAESVGARRAMIKNMDGKQTGDPQKAAEAVLMLAGLEDPPTRLLLGRDVYGAFRAKLAELDRTLTEWEAVSLGTDFDPN